MDLIDKGIKVRRGRRHLPVLAGTGAQCTSRGSGGPAPRVGSETGPGVAGSVVGVRVTERTRLREVAAPGWRRWVSQAAIAWAAGVELSGYIAGFLFHYQFEADCPQLGPAAMRVTLLERGDRLLPGFHPALSSYALKTLRSRGVDVRLVPTWWRSAAAESPSAAARGSRRRRWCGSAA
jgi:hypothetical protein